MFHPWALDAKCKNKVFWYCPFPVHVFDSSLIHYPAIEILMFCHNWFHVFSQITVQLLFLRNEIVLMLYRYLSPLNRKKGTHVVVQFSFVCRIHFHQFPSMVY